MAATPSRMVELGTAMPRFKLPDVSTGKHYSNDEFSDRPVLVMFICNHCPYVIHVVNKLSKIANQAQANGFGVVAVSSNDVENYPEDDPSKMAEFAAQFGFEFPYCYDESQAAARAFQAECTPDFFVYDKHHKLCYRGQMDSSRPGSAEPVTGSDLQAALTAVLEGRACSKTQTPSLGCNIKWKQ